MAQDPKTYTVLQGSVELLKNLLPRAEWYKDTPAQFVWGCMLLEQPEFADVARPQFDNPIPEKDDQPGMQRYVAARQVWEKTVERPYLDAQTTFTATPRQAQAIEAMLRFFIKNGAIQLSRYALKLIIALGIDLEDETTKKK